MNLESAMREELEPWLKGYAHWNTGDVSKSQLFQLAMSCSARTIEELLNKEFLE